MPVVRWFRRLWLVSWLYAIRKARVDTRLLRHRAAQDEVLDEGVDRELLRDLGDNERLRRRVPHHWAAYWASMLEVVLAAGVFYLFLFSSVRFAWFPFLLAVGLLADAARRWVTTFLDIFVITDLRVFRVSGVFSLKYASTPLTRILDITVQQPLPGRLLGFGHFTFESAAQEQGLKDIRFVSDPLERDQDIQSLQLRLLRGKKIDERP